MNVSELTGAALDWAVQEAQLKTLQQPELGMLIHRIGYGHKAAPCSTNWAQGGPIIEREGIALQRWLECGWLADTWNFKFATGHSQGPTPLIAAMRCYVASKLGFEIEIPEELNSCN